MGTGDFTVGQGNSQKSGSRVNFTGIQSVSHMALTPWARLY